MKTLTPLKKIKDPIFRGDEYHITENVKDIKLLQSEKSKLIKVIKELSVVYYSLQRETGKVKKDLTKVTTDRIRTLEILGSEISNELKETATKLKTKAENLDKKEKEIERVNKKLKDIKASQDELEIKLKMKAKALDKEKETVAKMKKELKKQLDNVKELSLKRKEKLSQIESNYQKSANILDFFEKEAKKERRYLRRWKKRLTQRGLELLAQKETLDTEKERLIIRQRKVRDEEVSLRAKKMI